MNENYIINKYKNAKRGTYHGVTGRIKLKKKYQKL